MCRGPAGGQGKVAARRKAKNTKSLTYSSSVALQQPMTHQRRFSYGNYSSVALQYPMTQTCRTTHDLSLVAANASPVFVQTTC